MLSELEVCNLKQWHEDKLGDIVDPELQRVYRACILVLDMVLNE